MYKAEYYKKIFILSKSMSGTIVLLGHENDEQGNLSNISLRRIDKYDVKELVIVTSDSHMKGAKYIFERFSKLSSANCCSACGSSREPTCRTYKTRREGYS
jgi:hypothetical protein